MSAEEMFRDMAQDAERAQALAQEALERAHRIEAQASKLLEEQTRLLERVRLAEQAEALARAERDLWRRAAMGHGIN